MTCSRCSAKGLTSSEEREDFNYERLCDDCYSDAINEADYEPTFSVNLNNRLYPFSDRHEAHDFARYWSVIKL